MTKEEILKLIKESTSTEETFKRLSEAAGIPPKPPLTAAERKRLFYPNSFRLRCPGKWQAFVGDEPPPGQEIVPYRASE